MSKYILNENVGNWGLPMQEAFLNQYSWYIDRYDRYGISLTFQPCYYYNGKYHTEKRTTGCFLAFRVRLYPRGKSFVQAVKSFMSQEFFTHKLMEIKTTPDGVQLKEYRIRDCALERFLDAFLYKAECLLESGQDPVLAIRENSGNFVRSWLYVFRYRNEVRTTICGHSLTWVLLFIVFLLICLGVYARVRRLWF